jgi:OmpA-OmpF porin, OOP family
MRLSHKLIGSALFMLLLSSCKKEEAAPAATPVVEPAAPAATTAAANSLEAATAPAEAEAAAPVSTDFSVESVPASTVTLPPFPFFKAPEGLTYNYDDKDSLIGFDRHYFLAGKKLVAVEGKLFHNFMNLSNPDSGRKYSEIEFHRNYENAIAALGGKKISTTQFTRAIVDEAGGLGPVEKYWRSVAPTSGYEHYSYLIRTAEKEYWIHIATGAIPTHGYVTVLEKEGMKQSVGFLDAGAMKKALDADGRVALYINFDVDKATLRPDSQPVMDEINKLLTSNGSLKLSIEGHTDSTGAPDHNRQLSTARARSVLGALVGLGIDPARLSSKGFGPDKPIADNANEAGRAKNRRVELVKM